MKGILKNKSDPINNIREEELQQIPQDYNEYEEDSGEDYDEDGEEEGLEFRLNAELDEDDEVEDNDEEVDNHPIDEGEQLRIQYEFQMKHLLDQVIATLPMNQLEYFQETFQQQQVMFQSFLFSQKINQQYQRCIRRQMRVEMKHQVAKGALSPMSSLHTIHNPLVATETPNSNQNDPPTLSATLPTGSIESAILSAQRRDFYQYAQRAVDCLSKEQQKVNEYSMTMEIVWQLFPFTAFSSVTKEEKKNQPIIFHCSYNGDNEGDGQYHWQLGRYSQDYTDYKTPTQLKITQKKLEKISKLLGLSLEDCHQILHGMFCSSFWSDV